MLSGIVIVGDVSSRAAAPRPEWLARSLSSLVPAVVEGLVSDVVVVGASVEPSDRRIADHAGCRVLAGAGALIEALRQAPRSHIFALLAGAVPEESFIDEVGLLMREREPPQHSWLLRLRRRGLVSILPAAVVGLVVPRNRLADLGRPDFKQLAQLRPASNLKSRARHVP
jgi:hypothetical protein